MRRLYKPPPRGSTGCAGLARWRRQRPRRDRRPDRALDERVGEAPRKAVHRPPAGAVDEFAEGGIQIVCEKEIRKRADRHRAGHSPWPLTCFVTLKLPCPIGPARHRRRAAHALRPIASVTWPRLSFTVSSGDSLHEQAPPKDRRTAYSRRRRSTRASETPRTPRRRDRVRTPFRTGLTSLRSVVKVAVPD